MSREMKLNTHKLEVLRLKKAGLSYKSFANLLERDDDFTISVTALI